MRCRGLTRGSQLGVAVQDAPAALPNVPRMCQGAGRVHSCSWCRCSCWSRALSGCLLWRGGSWQRSSSWLCCWRRHSSSSRRRLGLPGSSAGPPVRAVTASSCRRRGSWSSVRSWSTERHALQHAVHADVETPSERQGLRGRESEHCTASDFKLLTSAEAGAGLAR